MLEPKWHGCNRIRCVRFIEKNILEILYEDACGNSTKCARCVRVVETKGKM
jgi:hypothetical protein